MSFLAICLPDHLNPEMSSPAENRQSLIFVPPFCWNGHLFPVDLRKSFTYSGYSPSVACVANFILKYVVCLYFML